jgi:hypothetical protein
VFNCPSICCVYSFCRRGADSRSVIRAGPGFGAALLSLMTSSQINCFWHMCRWTGSCSDLVVMPTALRHSRVAMRWRSAAETALCDCGGRAAARAAAAAVLVLHQQQTCFGRYLMWHQRCGSGFGAVYQVLPLSCERVVNSGCSMCSVGDAPVAWAQGIPDSVTAAAWHPTRTCVLALGCSDGAVALLDTAKGRLCWSL